MSRLRDVRELSLSPSGSESAEDWQVEQFDSCGAFHLFASPLGPGRSRIVNPEALNSLRVICQNLSFKSRLK
jgi:hypothetical protein